MNTAKTSTTNAVLLAQLLERLERRNQRPDPSQYRQVAQRLAEALQQIDEVDALNAVLQAHPAAADIYENINYQHAGLCRSFLDASLASEQAARDAIARAARPRTEGSAQP